VGARQFRLDATRRNKPAARAALTGKGLRALTCKQAGLLLDQRQR
jgi:hypothetical protein